jgi:hypothetical protein
MRRLAAAGAVLLLFGLGSCARQPVSPQAQLPAPRFTSVVAGRLQTADLVETSGLAASRRVPGILWALNDSGNRPVLYALDADGAELGQVTLAGVENVDWEDLAAFSWRGEPWLLVADVGDNCGRRFQVVLHVLPEPQADEQGRFSGEIRPVRSLLFTYPDGPRDCEAVAVDEAAGQILLLSKRTEPPVLYRLPLEPLISDSPLVAAPLARLTTIPPPEPIDFLLPFGRYLSQPTAMDLSTDGLSLFVLTYRHAYLYHRLPGETWGACLTRTPQVIELPGLFLLPQREAACFSADGRSLFVTGEGAGAVLIRFDSY